MITLNNAQICSIMDRVNWDGDIDDAITSTINATLDELNCTPEPMPANTRYIDMGTNHLMTWDGATWRDDGPIDDVSHHLWQLIRDLQAKVAHLEATR